MLADLASLPRDGNYAKKSFHSLCTTCNPVHLIVVASVAR
jgi:hypothetical protein